MPAGIAPVFVTVKGHCMRMLYVGHLERHVFCLGMFVWWWLVLNSPCSFTETLLEMHFKLIMHNVSNVIDTDLMFVMLAHFLQFQTIMKLWKY